MEDAFLSCWQTETPPEFETLPGDTRAGTVIVGGGLCGLLCAYRLRERGAENVVILEADRVGSGTTGRSTGKITAQHGLIYRRLLAGLGEELAQQYAAANREAAAEFRAVAEREKIDCGMRGCDAYVYSRDADARYRMEAEAEAARKLHFAADVTERCALPFTIASAVRFGGQACFHPLRFVYRLAEILRERGVRIYEHTPAEAVEGTAVLTRRGRVTGENVVLCTRYPLENLRGLYFARLVQNRSCFVALRGAACLKDLYFCCDGDGCSFRGAEAGGESLLLFGDTARKTGHELGADHYAELEREARRLYPGSSAAFRWSAQDCVTNDGIPLAGRYTQMGKHVFVASGFCKWGMTGSMAAARVISDLIVDGRSDYEEVFSPDRKNYGMRAARFFAEAGDTAVHFIGGYFAAPSKDVSDLKNAEGGLVGYRGGKIGAFRDGEGELHCVSPVCTHLKCPLKWNGEEHTWECPCHGSRFDADGDVLDGPAVRRLDPAGPE